MPKLTGKVEFQYVCFRYQADTPEILRDLSFIIQSGALSHQLCKFREPLNSTIKFDHKMSHSFIPIGDRHRPFFGNIINCQI